MNGNAAKVVWPARRSTYRIAGPLGELLVRLRHSRSLGSLSVNGDLHVVVYDIPGLFDRSAGAAGGFVWFREEARAALPGATDFQLVSTSGARVRGRVVQRHGLSAAVVIEPTVVTRTKSETPYGEGRFAPAAIAGSGDNELVRRSGLLTVQGT